MKKNNLIVVTMMAFILCLSCCVSCKTAEPEVIVEYVPTSIDISPDLTLLFDARPNNSEQMKLIPKDQVDNSIKLLYNSWEYQCAWERWEDYAVGLEDYLKNLAEDLSAV